MMEEFTSELTSGGPGLEIDDCGTEARDCLIAGERIGELKAPKLHEIRGVPYLILPEELEADCYEHLLPRPVSLLEQRTFQEVEGFCCYVNEFADEASRLYFDDSAGEIKAVLDDHERADKPRWQRHTATLRLAHTEEWKAWTNMHRTQMKHVEFVEFLTEQLHTIAEPAGADILDAARTFAAHRNASFKSVMPAEGGDLSIGYSEELKSGTKEGAASLPSRLLLSLRPYKATDALSLVDVRVNWRLTRDGQLTFFLVLLKTEQVLEEAIRHIRCQVEEGTGKTVLA